jgi:PhnB protein
MKAKAIPEGFHSLTPSLIVSNSAMAIEFYQQVFDAKKRRMFTMPDGKTIYAEIQIGDSILVLMDEVPEMKAFSPLSSGGGTSAGLSCMLKILILSLRRLLSQVPL